MSFCISTRIRLNGALRFGFAIVLLCSFAGEAFAGSDGPALRYIAPPTHPEGSLHLAPPTMPEGILRLAPPTHADPALSNAGDPHKPDAAGAGAGDPSKAVTVPVGSGDPAKSEPNRAQIPNVPPEEKIWAFDISGTLGDGR